MKQLKMKLGLLLESMFVFHMAAFDSNEYAEQVGQNATPLDPTEAHGRVRIGHFQFDALTAAAADTLNLLKMPAGKVRVLGLHVINSAFAATADLDVGHGAYTNRSDRVAVAADPDAFANDLDVATAGTYHTYPDLVIDSAGGWTLTGVLALAGGTAETLRGWVDYVVD